MQCKRILNRFDVKENKWVLPDGMHKVTVLPAKSSINIELAKRIKEMVKKGGVVLGNGFKGTVGVKVTKKMMK